MNGSVTYEGKTILSGSLSVGTSAIIEPLNVSISENGTKTIETSSGVDGYSPITIVTNVPMDEPTLDSITINQNGTYTPPSGIDGYNEIVVNVPIDEPTLDSITINQNGTYTPPGGVDGYNEVVVNVPSVQLTAIAESLELLNEVNINYNKGNTLQSGYNYILIANTDYGIRSAIFNFNGSVNTIDLLDLGGRTSINCYSSYCYWDWNSGGVSWMTINIFELSSPLLPVHE